MNSHIRRALRRLYLYKKEHSVPNIGKINTLKVDRDTGRGLVLKDDSAEVFLPRSFTTGQLEIGSDIDVFVYLNTQGELIATPEVPFAQVGEFALLRAVETRDFGAFFDWGIDKDLLVPGNEQKHKVRNYEEHIVRVCLEEGTDRIYGTTKLGKYIELSKDDKSLKTNKQYDIEIVNKQELGFRVIVDKKYIGMIYHNEIFEKLRVKDKRKAILKKVREDGLLDLSLQKTGVHNLEDAKITILNYLKDRGGEVFLHDKSSPEDIKHALHMSKKSFKSAIGMLYKEKMILIEKDRIKLK